MLASFNIQKFRAFKDLRLEGLGDVNLVVGRNNVGKTVLLEALRLHATKGHYSSISGILSDREEYDRAPQEDDRREGVLNLSALLFGRNPEASPDPTIHLGPVDALSERLSIRFGRAHLEATGDVRQLRFEQFRDAEDASPLALSISYGDKDPIVIDEEYFWRRARMFRTGPGSTSTKFDGPPFVPAGRMLDTLVSGWWDAISLTDAEDRVVECLRIVSPIEKLALVQHPMRERSRIVLVKLKDEAEPVPLGSLGEGLRRMFGISLAMENARESKMLLIDEIENGIHYSALPGLWDFVNQAARIHGVQVFATTHSWDCVDAFQKVMVGDAATNGVLVKLANRDGTIVPTLFSESELTIVTRDHIEVR